MKKTLCFLLLAICLQVNAQRLRANAGLAGYLESDFKNSAFLEVKGGMEVKVNRFFKPEIGISYFAGSLEDDINRNSQGAAIDILSKKASAVNFSLIPKICLGNPESIAGEISFQILPKYNISRVEAQGNYILINQNNPSSSPSEKETISQWRHSFGIGLGIDIILSDKNYDSLSVNVFYNGVNMGKALTDLKHNDATYSTNNVLGVGFDYYFGFEKKKE